MSHSSRKDEERRFDTARGSHYISEEIDFEDDNRDHTCQRHDYDDRRREDREREDEHERERQLKREHYHETHSTKAIQREYAGTEIYPPNDARDRDFLNAALTRRNTRTDGNDELFALNEIRAGKLSRESEAHMASSGRHRVQVRDFAYPENDHRHHQPGNPNRRPSLDRDAITRWNRERKGKGRDEEW
ncbi:uncharacterized protein A1O9_01350 [Exophiala aquamarina CBS 119918]|uniref:Uncharacterized protein n=1 Tax=Exophiala aquamarina CBS 119918 TaxID=1182545 RepID=A0A072PVL4_9EURO|nr:uncharacterized protein A1O9_01350 [Exophiala aquamarina CBS 119918]KEF63373.1 hypothetical protein A1O9_01350 [Exophiala aquamarina CBS 119918]